ncbi:MAG: hypothetical protein DRQ55_02195 [Planctomycetota bacterium]|nr:MAG: hypothetical protein DRQ55_02195 [Planctomycetota bacterium]
MSLLARSSPLVLTLLLPLAGCAAPSPLDSPALRYGDVDVCGREVTTSSPEAQAWFDQGLTLLYGFNQDEATRSFHAATQADPGCAMAWWGLALASGIDLNDPDMSEQDCRRAHDAAQRALAESDGASELERALIEALATRYAWPAPDDRGELDQAYADAMQSVFARFGEDPDVCTLYADALMCMQPWDYWTAEGEMKGRVGEAIDALERALTGAPDHAGACHYLIHACEAGQPERAEPAADRLADRVPGSGHLLHMPSHIYVHVGRFADASDCNVAAIAADHRYFETAPARGNYMLYYVHNVHMLAFAAMMEGREQVAMDAARELEREVPLDVIEEMAPFVDGLMSTPLHVMVRFGHWEQILREPEPADFQLFSRANYHYARGVALSALGRTQEARVERAAFEQAAAAVPEDWRAGSNPSSDVLQIAGHMLAAELLWREGHVDDAFVHMAAGAAVEDAMVYDEPPGWMQPVRHAWGALLMADGRHADAEQVYRDDLARNPGTGWSILGLEQALRAQGQDAAADRAAAELALVWKRADVQATSSCYCEPGLAQS